MNRKELNKVQPLISSKSSCIINNSKVILVVTILIITLHRC